MKYCTFCGAQLKDTAKFCVECGKPCAQPKAQPAAQAPTAPVAAPASEPVAPAPVAAPVNEPAAPVEAAPVSEPAAPAEAPVSAQPEPAYTQPEPTYVQPEPTYVQPEPTYAQPEPAQPTPPAPPVPPIPPTQPAAAPVPPVPPVQPAAAPAKKKGNGKIALLFAGIGILVVALIVIAILFFTGKFGGSKSGDLGVYYADTAEMWGISVDISEIFGSDSVTVELKKGGVCTLTAGDSSDSGTWTQDGDSFSLTSGGITMDGTLQDGVMTLDNVLGMGLKMTFTKDGIASDSAEDTSESVEADSDLESALSSIFDGIGTTESESTSDSSENTSEESSDSDLSAVTSGDLDFWTRDWYGWWLVTDATGDYSDANGYWWDCCASIQDAGSGKLYMEIWDETFTRSELLASATLSFGICTDDPTKGTATAVSGMFLDGDLCNKYWSILPDTCDYDNMIDFHGYYSDADGSFDYYFCLRPWGTLWDDVALDNPDDVPYYYTSWYLPLIEEGASIPDVMDVTTQSDESELAS